MMGQVNITRRALLINTAAAAAVPLACRPSFAAAARPLDLEAFLSVDCSGSMGAVGIKELITGVAAGLASPPFISQFLNGARMKLHIIAYASTAKFVCSADISSPDDIARFIKDDLYDPKGDLLKFRLPDNLGEQTYMNIPLLRVHDYLERERADGNMGAIQTSVTMIGDGYDQSRQRMESNSGYTRDYPESAELVTDLVDKLAYKFGAVVDGLAVDFSKRFSGPAYAVQRRSAEAIHKSIAYYTDIVPTKAGYTYINPLIESTSKLRKGFSAIVYNAADIAVELPTRLSFAYQ